MVIAKSQTYLFSRVMRFMISGAPDPAQPKRWLKGVVMVIRAAAQDVESAKRLVVRLVGLFGGECASLRADGEVQLQPHEESNRALAQTLDAVASIGSKRQGSAPLMSGLTNGRAGSIDHGGCIRSRA